MMFPQIIMHNNEMKAEFRNTYNEYKEMDAKELREYAEHLLMIAAQMDKLNEALNPKPSNIPF